MQTVCREYTQNRDHKASRARGWIRGNTKIGPVLDVKVNPHQGRRCIRTGELVEKAEPRPKPTVTLSTVSVPCHERKWIDIDPALIKKGSFSSVKIYDQITGL